MDENQQQLGVFLHLASTKHPSPSLEKVMILIKAQEFDRTFTVYQGGQCTYPCFSGVLFTSAQYPFKATDCFPI